MGGTKRKTDAGFSDDLVMQLLIRLPGKHIGRCKCVCKSWKSMIESCYFKDVYGVRHRGMILYRRQPHVYHSNLLNIYYSTICGKQEEFSPLCTLTINDGFNRNNPSSMTQIVNGILCVDYEKGGWLSIYNVCTGERMMIPDLPHNANDKRPKFHLGYDPSSRRYKLLRLTSVYAHIMTLRPSSSSSTWELINFGIRGYMPRTREREIFEGRKEMKISPNDGFLCWLLPRNFLTLFDFSKEKFQKIILPSRFLFNLLRGNEGFVRAQFMEHRQRLAVSLWSISKVFQSGMVSRRLHCFVMDDDEGKRWNEHFIEFPPELDLDKAVFVAPNGNLSTASATELVLINTVENDVYCYDNTSKMEAQFGVGKEPDYPIDIFRRRYPSSLSCLYDANKLYLPLDDILSASE